MSATASAEPNWETVLAEVEADVARTEDLLRAATVARGTVRLEPVPPAELMLPAARAARMPDPALMPRVPVELLARITVLRARITEVGADLTAALEDISAHLARCARRGADGVHDTVRSDAAVRRPSAMNTVNTVSTGTNV